MRRLATTVTLVASLVLAGCAAEPAPPTSTSALNQDISDQQKKALADDKVTEDEYRSGFESFSACMTKVGYPITELGIDHNVIQYSIPAAAVDGSDEEKCYKRNFEQIDIKWQISHQDESVTADIVRRCLAEHDVVPEKTLDRMLEQLQAIHVDLSQCS